VATALTVQGPAGALGYRPVGAAMLTEQVEGLLREAPSTRRREAPIAAVKTGMLGSAASVTALSRVLDHPALRALPLVVDPVLAASSGLPLLRGLGTRSPAAVLAPLLARATVVTPNWPELEALAGASLATEAAAVRAARALPCAAVLVKGGHRRGAAVDLLVTRAAVRRFAGRRRRGTARGTGCRLASALAGLLARGATLPEAVRGAKALVERYLDRELGW
jgi:hydroxymethylpyrimidine/phosphomethylpyrimidine kinase